MKRLTLIAVVLLACLACASLATAGKGKSSKVSSTLNVKYKAANPSDPYGTSSFRGVVGPKKCAKGRKVVVGKFGNEKTDSKGKFSFTLSGPAKPDSYKVKVAPKTVGKGKKPTVCKKVKATVRVAK